MADVNIVEKDKFIFSLIKDIEEMYYDNPRCDYEHIHNITIGKVIDNLKTFYDEDQEDEVEIEEVNGKRK